MNSVLWEFQPVDTWFLRKSTPFGMGQSVGIRDIIFPPPVSTLQGAIRTAMARKQGWTPQNPELWPAALGTPDDLGAMTLRGPYLRHNGTDLFPFPRHLLRAADGWVRLRPGNAVRTDIGQRQLPVLARTADNVTPVENAWLTHEGLSCVLQGGSPKDTQIVRAGDLWEPEPHTGLMINTQTRTAETGMLFHTIHSRFTQTTRVTLEVRGIPAEWHQDIRLVPLGGEGRFAQVTTSDHVAVPIPPLPTFPPSCTAKGYPIFVVLLTPGIFHDAAGVLRNGPLSVPCLTGVVGRVEMQGGWDLQRHRPRPLRPLVPAGSVWFYHLSPEQWEAVRQMHGQQVGQEQEYGYGQVVFGIWEERE